MQTNLTALAPAPWDVWKTIRAHSTFRGQITFIYNVERERMERRNLRYNMRHKAHLYEADTTGRDVQWLS